MELLDYLAVVRRYWVTVVLVMLVGIGAGIAVVYTSTPQYRAQSSVFFAVRAGETPQELSQGLTFTQSLVASYTQVVTKPVVLGPVIDKLGLTESPQQLAQSVTAEAPVNTVILNVSVTDASPARAAAIANAITTQLETVSAELSPGRDAADSVKVTTIAAASVPQDPVSPRSKLILAAAALLGALAGLTAAILRSLLDTNIRFEDIVRLTGMAPLTTIPLDTRRSSPVAMRDAPRGIRAESYRQLRTNLQFVNVEGGTGAFVVTSALPGEGKSTAAVNLALAMAHAGTDVLLIDADLRSPALAELTQLVPAVGLSSVLAGTAALEDVVQPWGSQRLSVVVAGAIPPNPSELLGSSRMTRLLIEASHRYDVVILDASPLLPVTDAAILARATDGALLVVGYDKASKADVQHSLEMLSAVDAKLLGVALNRVPLDVAMQPKDLYGGEARHAEKGVSVASVAYDEDGAGSDLEPGGRPRRELDHRAGRASAEAARARR